MDIISRLQAHTVDIYNIKESDVVEMTLNSRLLLTPERFDLFAKLYYIRNREEKPSEAIMVYDKHIKTINHNLK